MRMRSVSAWWCLLLLLPLAACAKQYSAESIEAWVVDAETGKPLEGVVVTANWQVLEGTLAGTNTGGQLQILETVTDANGRFYFPAWAPKPLPPKKTGWMVDRYIGNEDPQLVLFKSGYEMLKLANHLVVSKRNPASVRISIWNGQTIRLKRFRGTAEGYAEHLWRYQSVLYFAYSVEECNWKHVPRMLAALYQENIRLLEAVPASYPAKSSIQDFKAILENCPSSKTYFQEIMR